MLNKKILIAALTLALCTTAFASCGRNVGTESEGSDTATVTESAPKETETQNKETTGVGTESTGTTETTEAVGTENGETTGMGSESDSTTLPGGGDIVGRIGEDVQNGMGNVKRGVQNFFDGEDTMPHAPRGHRGPVPFGK